eukprot:jgi/Bigna1/82640/fgenesh1_pg.95_\
MCLHVIQRRWRQIKSQEISVGNILQYKQQMCKVEKIETTMQGRGSNFYVVDMRAISNNKKHSARLRSGEKVELVELKRLDMQYLYEDDNEVYFMDPDSFEQIAAPADILGNYRYYVSAGEELEVRATEDGLSLVWAEIPTFADVEVQSVTGSAAAGRATAEKLTATTVNGRVITGCAKFVEAGTKIQIKVETEEYVGKADS